MNKNQGGLNRLIAGRTPVIGLVVLIVVAAGLVVDANKAEEDNFYSDIIRLDNVATKIHQNYVEEIPSKDLVDNAIDGILQILDPHTTYFEEKQYEELRIHTEGKFGGLGIQISIREKVLTVMTPIAGTPASRAGIQSGDQIIEIDGKPTRGITIDAAVGKLRGEPGSEVKIKIRRKGESKDLDYTLTREIIQIKSVPFAGVLSNNVGYIRLASFSEDAGAETEKAVRELLAKNIKALVFDLRFNPGGLLPQAIEVAEKFLPKKSLVVQTRGRVKEQNKEFSAGSNPVLPREIPMVVLVNAASASASEIVAGAIQDWDRGVIVGDTTFGKGSVQSILPLDNTHHLKLTTAFYYTPSGRCINKPENGVRGRKNADADSDEGDSTLTDLHNRADSGAAKAKADSSKSKKDTTTYLTKNGRKVFGGGGIIPDSVVQEKMPSMIVRMLFGKDLFFKFANQEHPKLKDKKIKIEPDFKVTESVAKDFIAYVDSSDFKFQSLAQIRFDDFKARAGITDSAADTLKKAQKDETLSSDEVAALKKASKAVDEILAKASDRAFHENRLEIDRYLADALLTREYGQDNEIMYRRMLESDDQLKAAIAIVLNKNQYDHFLSLVKK
jgi:carboxyl-terminal processing protease